MDLDSQEKFREEISAIIEKYCEGKIYQVVMAVEDSPNSITGMRFGNLDFSKHPFLTVKGIIVSIIKNAGALLANLDPNVGFDTRAGLPQPKV